MFTYYVWPDDTICQPEELEEYLTFMSDDFVIVKVADEDTDAIPSYAEISAALEPFQKV